MDDLRRQALLKEYSEVCNNFRLLTDIRFKLLAFVPIAAGASTTLKGADGVGGHLALSLFGLFATIGLITYNERNNQLYNELVGRAAAIERSLGLPDGAFANRPHPWLTIRLLRVRWKVDHDNGIATIYGASIALWLFGAFTAALQIMDCVLCLSDPSRWVNITAFAMAALITYAFFRLIQNQRKKREKELRLHAARAVVRAQTVGLSQAAQDAELVDACKHLCGDDTRAIEARARFLATLARESLVYYLPLGSKEQEACHLVALLTDLSPQWLFDCATNRRGRPQSLYHRLLIAFWRLKSTKQQAQQQQ